MFKVEKITEKLDLKVNDSDRCKARFRAFKKNYEVEIACLDDCCKDCSKKSKKSSYQCEYY